MEYFVQNGVQCQKNNITISHSNLILFFEKVRKTWGNDEYFTSYSTIPTFVLNLQYNPA